VYNVRRVMIGILLLFPLGAVALAAALARRCGTPERAVLALAALLLATSAALSPVAAAHDPWAHYEHLRLALEDPRRLLDLWDRPGFTLLAAGPAAFGVDAARYAAIATALVALAATMRAARALGLARPWVAGALLLAQYDFFGQGASTMTELPFAAALAVAIVGWAEDRPWLVAAGLGWAGITRPEGPAFVALGAVAMAVRWRRPGPPLAASLPFLAYVVAGSAAFANPRWLLDANPYASLVSVDLDPTRLARSWFFTALVRSQGPALAALELGGALVVLGGGARRLRFLLAPVGASFLLLTLLRIGPTEAWLESRYLVAIAPPLALLAAAALDAAFAGAPRAAPPVLLAGAALGSAFMTCWHWGQIGAWGSGLLGAVAAAGLAAAGSLWLVRRTVSPVASLAALLLVPLLAVPPGVLARHRGDIPSGDPRSPAPLSPPSRPASDLTPGLGSPPAAAAAAAPAGTGAARRSP
jgi:hypothetical protein